MTKSSLLTRLSNAVTPSPPTIAELQRRIDAASAALPDLERARDIAALAAESGEGADRLTEAERALVAGRDRVAKLQAAVRAAQDRDATRAREARDALRQSRLAAFRKHLEARDAAAVRLAEGIAALVADWQLLVKHSTAAGAASPSGHVMDGTLLSAAELAFIVRQEFDRYAAGAIGETNRFPCGVHGGSAFDPAAVPSLAEEIARASAHAVKQEQEGWSP